MCETQTNCRHQRMNVPLQLKYDIYFLFLGFQKFLKNSPSCLEIIFIYKIMYLKPFYINL